MKKKPLRILIRYANRAISCASLYLLILTLFLFFHLFRKLLVAAYYATDQEHLIPDHHAQILSNLKYSCTKYDGQYCFKVSIVGNASFIYLPNRNR
jgi:hypothetical protein